MEDVAGRTGDESVLPEQLAQLHDEVLERALRRLGRLLAPKLLDQFVRRDDLTCAHEQEAEQGTLLLAAEHDRTVVIDDLERAEDPKFDHQRRL